MQGAATAAAAPQDINAASAGGSPPWELLGFLDDSVEAGQLAGGRYPVLGGLDWLRVHAAAAHAVVAVGASRVRQQIVARLAGVAVTFATLVHPSVLAPDALQPPQLGEGALVLARAILSVNTRIGRHAVVYWGCTVGHDSVLEDFVTLLPCVNISGNCVLEEGTDVGTGCQVIQKLRVHAGTIVGAGAVVVRDLPPNCTAVGVPARPIKGA